MPSILCGWQSQPHPSLQQMQPLLTFSGELVLKNSFLCTVSLNGNNTLCIGVYMCEYEVRDPEPRAS